MPSARCGQHPRPDDRNRRDSKIYDPSAVPEWARESIARIARDHPGSLAHWLAHVAEVEAAKQRAPRETSQAPPMSARDTLHLAAIEAWQAKAIASGRPAPRLDLLALYQAICEAFETSGSQNPIDQFYSTWEHISRQHAITITDEHGDLLPDLDDAITGLITAAIWFGITTGYFTIAGGRYHIPRKFLAA